MKDLTEETLTYNSRKPEDFLQIPINFYKFTKEDEGLYLPSNSLTLGAPYAPIGKLCDKTGGVYKEYNRGQFERLLQSIQESVIIEIPNILEEAGKSTHLQQFVTQIVVDPQFPKNGRELVYGVGFLNR